MTTPPQMGLLLEIVRVLDERPPCVLEARLLDAGGQPSLFVGPFQVASVDGVDAALPYSPSAFLPCVVLTHGGRTSTVETAVASSMGKRTFIVSQPFLIRADALPSLA